MNEKQLQEFLEKVMNIIKTNNEMIHKNVTETVLKFNDSFNKLKIKQDALLVRVEKLEKKK